ncbi:Hypothetical predicted protein, partial [Pelobates cultripes]
MDPCREDADGVRPWRDSRVNMIYGTGKQSKRTADSLEPQETGAGTPPETVRRTLEREPRGAERRPEPASSD